MSTVIVANGELTAGEWVVPYLRQATTLIAADGGLDHLLTLGRTPDVVIGDLDSATKEALAAARQAEVEVLVHPAEKDETDLELALRYAAAFDDQEIIVLGSLGGRLDQSLANVFLLIAPFLHGRRVKIVEPNQEAWIMSAGENHISGSVGDRVSLLPLGGDARIKQTTGLAWPLVDEPLLQGMSRGISNRLIAETATVEIAKGTLLCVHLAAGWQR
jgi:thiamine pyrophosphokinase